MLPRSLHTTGFALIAAGLAGCGQDPPQAQPPQGAVLRIGEEWVLGQDVDAWVEGIKLIEPGQTLNSLRRKALVNIVVPCAVSRQLFEEDRGQAKTAGRNTGTREEGFQAAAGTGAGNNRGTRLEKQSRRSWKSGATS